MSDGGVIFRADASTAIGTGHVMRSLTLAASLHDAGVPASFICRTHEGHLCDLIEDRGFAVSRLSVETRARDDTSTHASWLGTTWQEDAQQTRNVVEASAVKPQWLVADHYAIDRRWQTALRPFVGRIMVIDDLANRPHDCDVLLDQNLVAHAQTRYDDKIPPWCHTLLGPEYALLDPIYAELHDRMRPREGDIRRILIFFGGSDAGNLTGRSLSAFLSLQRPDIEVDVVLPVSSPHVAAIEESVVRHANIHLHRGVPTLAPLMAEADLAIGAAGTTSWERLCLGLPALVVTLADNQRPIAEELHRRGLVRWLGHHDSVNGAFLSEVIGRLVEEGIKKDWSVRCSATVDGRGVHRTCAALTVTAATPLRVRAAAPQDEDLVLRWANDPVTRRNGFNPQPISAAIHKEWFRGRLRDSDGCRFYIVETTRGVALGQVRLQRDDQTWNVNYAVAPGFRGRGLGRPLLAAALQTLRTERRGEWIAGDVRAGNDPSRKIFEALGFEVTAGSSDADADAVRYQCPF